MGIEYVLTSLVLAVTPGTGVLYTVTAGLSRGTRAGLVAALGCTLGIVPHVAAAVTGMAALLHTSAVAFQVLKYLGVAYLLFLAWRTWRDRSAFAVHADPAAPRSARQVVVSAVLVNVLNPKLTISFVAFLPQFVGDSSGAVWQMLQLSAVFMLVTPVVFAGCGWGAAAVRTHVLTRPRVLTWLRRTVAAAFVALGAKLATAER